MPITIADVAARAGVSKTTVSRVLNGRGELDASTVERVRLVIDELGYVPSARAVSLARGKTGVIGMLVRSFRSLKAKVMPQHYGIPRPTRNARVIIK